MPELLDVSLLSLPSLGLLFSAGVLLSLFSLPSVGLLDLSASELVALDSVPVDISLDVLSALVVPDASLSVDVSLDVSLSVDVPPDVPSALDVLSALDTFDDALDSEVALCSLVRLDSEAKLFVPSSASLEHAKHRSANTSTSARIILFFISMLSFSSGALH